MLIGGSELAAVFWHLQYLGLVPALQLWSPQPQKISKASENDLMNFEFNERHLQHLENLPSFS